MKNVNATSRRGGIKSWLVEPYRQIKLGLLFLLLNLLFAILIFLVFGYYVIDMYDAMSGIVKLLSLEQGPQMLKKFISPMAVGGGVVIAFVIATLILSIRYTHQIYGPLVSIQRFLDELLAGKKPKRIYLRSSDQLQELAEKLNSVAERMVEDGREGPLVSIHRFLDGLIEGKSVKKIQLREGDPYYELAEKLNALADELPRKSDG
ncbi:MAG: hypothetical protein R3B45_17580 [Bdellovibrionota bacterium]